MKKNNVLYLSYDGMTDPLGQAQVLPYIFGLTQQGYSFTLISFEKKDRYYQIKTKIEQLCLNNNVEWIPLFYTKKPPILSTIWDLYRLRKMIEKQHQRKNFSIVHCRSYVPSLLGLFLKQKYNVKFLFDMRGFWADERVDGELWNLSKFYYKWVYQFFKKKEKQFISQSDAIVSLTQNGKSEIMNWNLGINDHKITVIPCVADYQTFNIQSKETNEKTRQSLNINEKTKVLSYIGSLGTWYLLDDMLAFYTRFKQRYKETVFLILTPDSPDIVHQKLHQYDLEKTDVTIRFVLREELVSIASVSDLSVFFIKDSYSKKSSSPTKMGEILAMGIPIVCNDIGDVGLITQDLNVGVCLDELTIKNFDKALEQIENDTEKKSQKIREVSKYYFLLENGVEKYTKIYHHI